MKVLLLSVLLVSGTLYGQNISQFGLSNNGGIYSSLNNPAEGSGANEWLSVNLIGIGNSMESNMLHLDLDYSLVAMMTGKPRREHAKPYTMPLYATRSEAPKKPAISLNMTAMLPSFRINPAPNYSVFFIARDRVMGNLQELGKDMVPLLMQKQVPTALAPPELGMKMRMMGIREYAMGMSAVLWQRHESYVSAGFSIKRNYARFAYLVELGEFTATPHTGGTHISANYRLVSTDMKLLYPSAANHFTLANPLGKSWSFDLGFVYEHRPGRLQYKYRILNRKGKNANFRQRDQVLYDYRIGISLSDIGNITLKGAGISDNQYRYEGNLEMQVPKDHSIDDWKEDSEVVYSSDSINFRLPAVLNLFVDYRLSARWFIQVHYQQNLRDPRQINNLFNPSSLSGLLRRETRHFTFGIPFRVVPGSRSVTAGFLVQAGPFFLGTNNALLLFSREVYNVSVFTGLCFRIRYKGDPTLENFKPFR